MALNTLPNAGLTKKGYPSDRLVTPIIINGDMSVAQRATSKTGLTNGVAGYYTIDRFAFRETGDTSAVFTMSQDTDVPTGQGFAKSMKLDCTTADASPGSGDWVRIRYRVEGQDLQMIKKGTSSAETLTMSFWAKSSKTGTYIVSIYDDDNSGRIIAKAYTISSANTWEKKVITFAGDTTGTLTNDNSSAFRIEWHLLSGSDYQSGTLATSWQTFDATDLSVGQVNLADNTSNNWYITGVQLEVGEFDSTSIPSFPFESFTSNLIKCSRYYTEINQNGANGWRTFSARVNGGADVENIGITLPTFLRIGNPTVTKDSGAVAQAWDESGYHVTAGGGGTFSILTDSGDNTPYLNCKQNGFSGLTGGAANYSIVIGTPSVAVDAEL
jgi:hypothetical protein